MANMGYCRFENAANDLEDCQEWLSDNDPATLSDRERKAFKRMVRICFEIGQDYAEDIKN